MTNGEYIAGIVEQDEDFFILTDAVEGTVTIEVSLDWWNKTKLEAHDIKPQYEAKVITRGNCMMCGKELTEGLFLCKECKAKVRK